MPKRKVAVKVNPGEPLDGTGQVCIHLFVRDQRGPFVEPHVLHQSDMVPKQLEARPTRGRLACDPKRTVAPVKKGGVIIVTPRTDDPRAATCPKCIASEDYKKSMQLLTADAE